MKQRSARTRKIRKQRGGQMKVSYPSFTLKNMNTSSTIEATQSIPTIQIGDIPLSTLIMQDPDSSQPSWLHYLVVNIPNGDISKGNVVVSYNGPSPPKGTGVHHYIFELYSQQKSIQPDQIERSGFNPKQFAKLNGLQFLKKQSFKVDAS